MNEKDTNEYIRDWHERMYYKDNAIRYSRSLMRKALNIESCETHLIGEKELDEEILLPATRAGRITQEQADAIYNSGCVVRYEQDNGYTCCALAQIAIVIQDEHRIRAKQCAELLKMITGYPTFAYVIGIKEEPPNPGAELSGATFIHFRPKRYFDHILPDEP